jgi:alpha,alpha-trehalose phosphorylase
MTSPDGLEAEPWCLRESTFRPQALAWTESLFALANGHIGWRGNLDEGEPHGMPGSYLNGVHEDRPLPHAEAGYAATESGETIINVSNGKLIRLHVDDEPFDVRDGTLRSHERVLDFRSGTLDRRAEWTSPAGTTVRVTSRRLVSFSQRAVAAIRYEVEPVDKPARVVVQSELVANEQLPGLAGADPRGVAMLDAPPLQHEEHEAGRGRALLIHRTKRSGLLVAAAMDHVVECPVGVRELSESRHDLARLTLSTLLHPGQRLGLVKFVGYAWSGERSRSALRDQVEGALTAAAMTGWEGLLAEQREYLDAFWKAADVELEGDSELQQAVRFALFHLAQACARAEGHGIGAKGLTGPGYDGHAFWDTEVFVLPVLTLIMPSAARDALSWRHSTIDRARARAGQLGLRGAAFAWRTIGGRECSGNWPAGTAAFHVNADIAHAVISYVDATGDREFEAGHGLDLLVETARLWQSLGHYDVSGRFRIDGVTGPDEYSALADNNVYTNLMAQQNLRAAAAAAQRYHVQARDRLGVGPGEPQAWLATAGAMVVPFDEKLGVHPQAEGFTRHQEWDFAAMSGSDYPLMLHFPYFDLYRRQVVKQADLVLAMHLCPHAFTAEQKERNFRYYERLTVRDSSLSACSQAVIAAEVGHLDLAYDYLAEAALTDLRDLRGEGGNGVHLAALAGSLIALVRGLGGMRRIDGMLGFAPRLPGGLRRLSFTVGERGRVLRVDITGEHASYRLADGEEPLRIQHHGSLLEVTRSGHQTLPIPALPARARPAQPPGREPARRSPAGG